MREQSGVMGERGRRAPAPPPDLRDAWVREVTALDSWAELADELRRGWRPTLRVDLYEPGSPRARSMRALRLAVAHYLVIELKRDAADVARRDLFPALDRDERRLLVRRVTRSRTMAGAA